jgi:hypothetical protein
MSGGKALSVLLKLGLVAAAVLFTIQNMSRTSGLSLDLWAVGFELGEPQPIPFLIWSALAAGLVLGIGWGVQGRRQFMRRIRQLEAELVRQELGRSPEPESTDWG